METLTLLKFLAKYADIPRREADAAIRSGRAEVNGACVLRPEFRLSPEDEIFFDGRKITATDEKFVYIMLNKPAGFVCSAADPHAEHLAVELIDVPQRIFSAGRLDRDSEGLILFSNDGSFTDFLSHPKYGVKKLYEVTVNAPLTENEINLMCSGICESGETLKALQIKSLGSKKYSFLLNEGKKREIRRLVKYTGKRVVRLVRTRQGNLELGALPQGKWRYLTPEEVVMAKENAPE